MAKKAKMVSWVPKMVNGSHHTWTDKFNGLNYSFIVTMDNGETGEASSKKPGSSWKQGVEYTYEITTNEHGSKIKGLKEAVPMYQEASSGGGKRWEEDTNKDFYISKMVALEAATNLFVKLDQTNFTDPIAVKKGLEAAADVFAKWIIDTSTAPPNVIFKQIVINRQNALRRAVEQVDIPVLQINGSLKVLERAREIEAYYNLLPTQQ